MFNFQELSESVISTDRLKPYGSLNPIHIQETLAKYLWNMGLSESLYLPLNGLEVSLRNRIQRTQASKLGKERWWDPKWNLLPKRELAQVKKAMGRIIQEGKNPNVGRVVSGLTLGFWVGLFAGNHERQLWKGNALRMTFPYAPRRELAYHKLRRSLYRIRYLRNRVFHHEPIWHWKDLDEAYNDIVNLTAWLSIEMNRSLHPYDRFEGIYRAGYQPYFERLREIELQ